MLPVTYDPVLVVGSVLVAVMASYTGLRLTVGIGALAPARRKSQVAKAAVALGGGIWSMHFVGMLAVSIPASIRYDALPTLGSVLVAILVTGLGMMILHFGRRTRARILLAGTLTGLGIVSMHYLGMSAISGNCTLAYDPTGLILSTAIAVVASSGALWLAYSHRAMAEITLGAVLLGITISAMHYTAMIYTRFSLTVEIVAIREPNMSDGTLALIVAMAAFVICGLFLLTALPAGPATQAAFAGDNDGPAVPVEGLAPAYAGGMIEPVPPRSEQPPHRLPYEQNETVRFIDAEQIHCIRAEGHYTKIFNGQSDLFCPWSISRVADSLEACRLVRTHRSYLVNLAHVRGLRREGDKLFCLVGDSKELRVPVSRSHMAEVRRALGMA